MRSTPTRFQTEAEYTHGPGSYSKRAELYNFLEAPLCYYHVAPVRLANRLAEQLA